MGIYWLFCESRYIPLALYVNLMAIHVLRPTYNKKALLRNVFFYLCAISNFLNPLFIHFKVITFFWLRNFKDESNF